MEEYDLLVKLLVIGDSGVGKSSLLLRYAEGTFSEHHLATIGVDFKLRTDTVLNKRVKIQVWDTAGQERFKSIAIGYYRGAHGIAIVYDVTNEQSFNNVKNWLEQITDHASEHAQLILVGNKCDLDRERCVDRARGEELANSLKIPFVETSAKNSVNVEAAFSKVVTKVVEDNIEHHGASDGSSDPTTIVMDIKGPNAKKTANVEKGIGSSQQSCCK
ncbi:Ras-related protein Rab [Acrasis kona]|uniref:Ras-related protein Rab n=1 Tax=Acrasis kona TaxID=1008807 RepID=A0AAW2ZG57_9EUKA